MMHRVYIKRKPVILQLRYREMQILLLITARGCLSPGAEIEAAAKQTFLVKLGPNGKSAAGRQAADLRTPSMIAIAHPFEHVRVLDPVQPVFQLGRLFRLKVPLLRGPLT